MEERWSCTGIKNGGWSTVKQVIPQSRGIASDQESQHDAARSSRGLRGNNRIARRPEERERERRRRLGKAIRICGR